MGRWTAERWAASTGIGFVIVLVIGNLIPGSPKKYNASAASIVGYLQDKHKELLIAGVLYGIGPSCSCGSWRASPGCSARRASGGCRRSCTAPASRP